MIVSCSEPEKKSVFCFFNQHVILHLQASVCILFTITDRSIMTWKLIIPPFFYVWSFIFHSVSPFLPSFSETAKKLNLFSWPNSVSSIFTLHFYWEGNLEENLLLEKIVKTNSASYVIGSVFSSPCVVASETSIPKWASIRNKNYDISPVFHK